ncbi:hypothetical protein SLEP1_g51941 [Rubroshorea leprosula]|uniref:PRP1 splicing factor N-terminal domain-containing protein n=1 Tax=Rubroshorea leprosula TaxID=152421 RepID=A0AAV5M710_9ROSI|nr:hypothetical protein SLEP1_g51941 [Rubroshorea leprosula]
MGENGYLDSQLENHIPESRSPIRHPLSPVIHSTSSPNHNASLALLNPNSPPSNYVAGLSRGATGFTTQSDIGPTRLFTSDLLDDLLGLSPTVAVESLEKTRKRMSLTILRVTIWGFLCLQNMMRMTRMRTQSGK